MAWFLKLLGLLAKLGLAFRAGRSSGVAEQKAVEEKHEDKTAHAILKAVEAAPTTVAGTRDSLQRGTF